MQHDSRGRESRYTAPELAAFIGQHIADLDPFLSRLPYEMRDTPERTRMVFTPSGGPPPTRVATQGNHQVTLC